VGDEVLFHLAQPDEQPPVEVQITIVVGRAREVELRRERGLAGALTYTWICGVRPGYGPGTIVSKLYRPSVPVN
jgi:hypothetical protein